MRKISPISWAGHLFGYTVAKALFATLSIGCFVATLFLLRRVLEESQGEVPGWVDYWLFAIRFVVPVAVLVALLSGWFG